MPALTRPAPAKRPSEAALSDEVLRFRISERRLHWAIAIPFMVCYTTALVLVLVYNPNPARPFREVVSWIHRISGVCFVLVPLWAIVRHRHDHAVHIHNIREAWMWTADDLKWLIRMGPAAVNKKVSLPHQGKFNAAEKINFMVLTMTYPLFILTGLLIWLPGAAYLSWLLHISMAAVATPLMLGHIFMATINPDTRVGLSGMISGFVDRQWAKHHYRRWFDEHYGTSEPVAVPVVEPDQPQSCSEAIPCASPETDESVAA